MSTETNF